MSIAVNYMLGRWDSFLRHTTDGRLEMTNNAAERSIKPCVLGRKNYPFQGSDAGGVRLAIFLHARRNLLMSSTA